MHDLLHFFTHISDEVRGVFLVGGLTLFLLLESSVPLFKMDYSKLKHAGINISLPNFGWITYTSFAPVFKISFKIPISTKS